MTDATPAPRARPPKLRIGLVNNMPDSALAATERQFTDLVTGAAEALGVEVSLGLYSLPGVPRSNLTRESMAARYQSTAALKTAWIDALIVTGAEPRTADLRAEPYWDGLTELVDWARTNTTSTLWSCLAAHAAVLHLDGIEREPLAEKCSGVYACEKVAVDPLTEGLPEIVRMPHSRRNGLSAAELTAGGYRLLTESRSVGADIFVRRREPSLFVFVQGHPEYDADGLLREYCRDVARHLRGEQETPPTLPFGYFDQVTESFFRALAAEAAYEPASRLMARCGEIASAFTPPQPWKPHAQALFRNWVSEIVATKGARAAAEA
jgi:homoserine O-succinyltransferase